MAFQKTTWVNGGSPGIAAPELNRIEDGIYDSAPPGAVMMFAAAAAPTGWLLCQGQAVNRTTYADLFAVIGTTFGSGDGSTTFNLPDLRQRFPLGKAAAGTGSALGSTGGQIDPSAALAHTHDIGHGHADTLAVDSGGAHTHSMQAHTHSTDIDHDHPAAAGAAQSNGAHTHTGPAHTHFISDTSSGPSGTTAAQGGSGSSPASSIHTHSVSDTSTSEGDAATSSDGAHTHTVDLPNYNVANRVSSGPSVASTDSQGAHTHPLSGAVTAHAGNSGSALGSTSIPNAPFIALNFIIKT